MRKTQLVGPTFLTTDLKFQLSKEGEGGDCTVVNRFVEATDPK